MADLPRHTDALWVVLAAVTDGSTYAELADLTGLSTATISRHVGTLTEEGWVTADRDGRFIRVGVTDAGLAASIARARLPTVAAVVAEARAICREAQKVIANDPYARPYVPSDRVAQMLSRQHGPEDAILMLRMRARDRRERERLDRDERARVDARHERRQRQAQRDRRAQLAGLSLGQRIDGALRGLSTLQAVPAARLDTEPVTDGGGGKDGANPVPNLYDDTAGHARRRVEHLVRELEQTLAEATRRLCDFERVEAA